jgi:hypothetical protein
MCSLPSVQRFSLVFGPDHHFVKKTKMHDTHHIISVVDRDMFMCYLGGRVGHYTERQEDLYNGDDDDDMWIDEDEDGSQSTSDEMQTDINADN